ncbi:MAG: phosphatase PAP2 family protein [Vicinamibacterales bacterium]
MRPKDKSSSRRVLVILSLVGSLWASPAAAQTTAPGGNPASRSPLAALADDFRHVVSVDAAAIGGSFAAAALVAHQRDDEVASEARTWSEAAFKAGNVGGDLSIQGGLALGTYLIGKVGHHDRAVALGRDLVGAQIVSGVITQGLKFSAGRLRPDGSNHRSFPSGHASSAFATASVLERHFGWKAAVPAYAFGAYVGAARMAEDKHFLSDVIAGAAIGIVAGHAATFDVHRQRVGVGVAPTDGGAALTFSIVPRP